MKYKGRVLEKRNVVTDDYFDFYVRVFKLSLKNVSPFRGF